MNSVSVQKAQENRFRTKLNLEKLRLAQKLQGKPP